jgi:hypothetical protein
MAELHPELARRTAQEALARAERTPCERGSDLGWALDTIVELSAMVCNLADRTDPPCGHMLRGIRKPYCERCQRAAAGSAASGAPDPDAAWRCLEHGECFGGKCIHAEP